MSKGKMIAIGVLAVVAAVIVFLMFSDTGTPDDTTNPDGTLPDGTPAPPYRATVTQITEFSNSGVRKDRYGNEITEFSQYGSDGKVIAIYVLKADKTGYDIKK